MHEDTVAGVRAYADWLEEHGGQLADLYPWVFRNLTDVPRTFAVDDREELARITGLFGRVDSVEIEEPLDEIDRQEGNHTVYFYRQFGGGVSVYAYGACKDLCEPVDELVSVEPISKRSWVAPPLLSVVS